MERDIRVKWELESLGWDVVVIWECEIADHAALASDLRKNLGNVGP